jgi:hypothetical protein
MTIESTGLQLSKQYGQRRRQAFQSEGSNCRTRRGGCGTGKGHDPFPQYVEFRVLRNSHEYPEVEWGVRPPQKPRGLAPEYGLS